MIDQGTGRPAGRLAALGLILLAGLGTWAGAIEAGAIGAAPAFASGEGSGEDSGAPDGTRSSPTGTSNCPSSNPPNQLTLVAGTPQTTILERPSPADCRSRSPTAMAAPSPAPPGSR